MKVYDFKTTDYHLYELTVNGERYLAAAHIDDEGPFSNSKKITQAEAEEQWGRKTVLAAMEEAKMTREQEAFRRAEKAQRKYLNGPIRDRAKLLKAVKDANDEYIRIRHGKTMTVPELIKHLRGRRTS